MVKNKIQIEMEILWKTINKKQKMKSFLADQKGYVLILVLLAVFVLTLSLLVAVPVLETQTKREKEEELIFRGLQYVEAIRLYQQKKPGAFPSSLEELIKQKCLRKLYPDPMSASGKWNLLLIPPTTSTRLPAATAPSQTGGQEKLLVVPEENIKSINNPQIIGVVSTSQEKSIRIYNGEEYYYRWLFYYGQTPEKKPELIYQTEQKEKK